MLRKSFITCMLHRDTDNLKPGTVLATVEDHRKNSAACEEQQLFGTEEKYPSKMWTINEERREIHTDCFRSLEVNSAGLVAGSVARDFFKRSHLPDHVLRKICCCRRLVRSRGLRYD
ncbi:uncharacterized protein LOC126161313 [Schistocerca cancellata]|uniref:uncharacterized protein LOC126161313 n=1 Tax=Schistocerca cancellata TaxID=274614 RepID=UPI00211832EB|nr:uncharacterized protein LOC126161313 [Schistocerca cancellata]